MKLKILLIVCIITFLTGCQSGNVNSVEVNESIDIDFHTMWVEEDSKAFMLSELIEEFNMEYPNVNVNITPYYNYQAYQERMKLLLLTGELPDMFTAREDIDKYLKSSQILNLTGYMDEEWKSRFIDNVFDDLIINDSIMGIPFEYGAVSILYNKNLLEEVGITKENFPTNYDDFFKMCDSLKYRGITPMSQMTGENAWTSMLWYSAILTSIGGVDVYEDSLDNPAYFEAARIIKKMYNYTTKDAVGATASKSGNYFLNGQTAMLMNGSWYIGKIKNHSDEFYNSVDVAYLPNFNSKKEETKNYMGFVQASILLKKQDNPEKEQTMVDFLKYITRNENIARLSKASGSLFVIKLDDSEVNDLDYLQRRMILQLANTDQLSSHFLDSMDEKIVNEFPIALTRLVLNVDDESEFIKSLKDCYD